MQNPSSESTRSSGAASRIAFPGLDRKLSHRFPGELLPEQQASVSRTFPAVQPRSFLTFSSLAAITLPHSPLNDSPFHAVRELLGTNCLRRVLIAEIAFTCQTIITLQANWGQGKLSKAMALVWIKAKQ